MQPPPEEAGPGESAQDAPAEPPKTRSNNRRLLVAISAVLALAAAAGGGLWAVDRLAQADRTAPTVVWAEPEAPAGGTKSEGAAKAPEGLAASLLPVPYSYEPGPDIDKYGNDVSLTRRQAVAVFKEGSRGLPSAQRNKRNKAVDKLELRGIAMRSYRTSDGDLVIETQLARIESAGAGRALADFQSVFANALGIFPKGPRVPGFKNAKCFLMPKDAKSKLDGMFCSAYQGDVLVSTVAYGTKPFQATEVVKMLGEQLDRFKSPGRFV
ncbi:hypothetical protein [Streptomyces sp. NPDC054887]